MRPIPLGLLFAACRADAPGSADPSSGDTAAADTAAAPPDCAGGAAATVEERGFASVSDAVAAANGATVSVCPGTWAANLTLSADATIVGAGEGASVLDGGDLGPVIEVAGAALSVSDLTVTGGVALDRGAETTANWGGGLVARDATVTLERVTFRGNEAMEGGGLGIDEGSVDARDVRFEGNVAHWGGGGMAVLGYSSTTAVACHTCTFEGNAAAAGGGIATYGYMVELTLDEGTVVRDNVVQQAGGGIAVGFGSLSLHDVVVEANRVTAETDTLGFGGGGISLIGARVTAANTLVAGNDARRGGGLSSTSGGEAPVEVSGLRIEANSAVDGGGAYLEGCGALVDVEVVDNAASTGGGLFVASYCESTVHGGSIVGNTAALGGGLYVAAGSVRMEAVDTAGNTPDDAATPGGSYSLGPTATAACDAESGCE